MSPADPAPDARLARAHRALAFAVGVALALAAALAWSLARDAGDAAGPAAVLDDTARQAAIERIVADASGVWDAHVDPDVGRVLQPGLDGSRELYGVPMESNRFGMREREWGPKAPGTTRIVLLGDSFVLGHGTPVDERVGVFLARELEARGAAPDVRVEVLHVGISSWNILAECAFLRRQLAAIDPDLVVQLVFNNDLDDVKGVRGFGDRSSFAPRHRERANGFVGRDAPQLQLGVPIANLLLYGLDHESRTRYAEAADALGDLAEAVEARGGEYLCLAMWLFFQPMVEERLAVRLRPEQLAYVSDAFLSDKRTWADEENNHWNAVGAERIARFVYGLCAERGLLAELELAPWPDAAAEGRAVDGAGREDAADRAGMERRLAFHRVAPRFELARLDQRSASQVNGGLDPAGHVAPYTSLTLATDGGRRVRVRGARLEGAFGDAVARVLVDGEPVGEIALGGGEPIDFEAPVPAAAAARAHVTVAFEADDWIYVGELRDRCAAFRLESVELLP